MTTTRETENRTRRALALVETLRRSEISAETARGMGNEHWALATEATWPNDEKKYSPSEATRAMVVTMLEEPEEKP